MGGYYGLYSGCHEPPPPPLYVEGEVTLHADMVYDFGMQRPQRAGMEEHSAKGISKEQLFIERGHQLTFQFLNNDHLTLKVPREVAFTEMEMPESTPEYVKFIGIRYD